jgi:MFS family permease
MRLPPVVESRIVLVTPSTGSDQGNETGGKKKAGAARRYPPERGDRLERETTRPHPLARGLRAITEMAWEFAFPAPTDPLSLPERYIFPDNRRCAMGWQSEEAWERGKWMALTAALLGWMFDGLEMGLFPLTARSALLDLGLAEADLPRWLGIITAFFLVGAATGGVLFGWLGDRLGRVKAMILSVVTYALFSGACGLAAAPWQIGVLRFVAALGMGGEWSLGVALINEIWPGRSRAFLAGLIGAAANAGYLGIALVGGLVINNISSVRGLLAGLGLSETWIDHLVAPQNKGWRLLMIFGAAPALLTLFIRLFVPESRRWEAERDRGATSHWANRDLLAVLVGAVAACAIIGLWSSDRLPLLVQAAGSLIGLTVVTGGYLLPVVLYLRRAEQVEGPRAVGRDSLRLMLLAACLSGVALLGTWGTVQQAPPWSGSLTGAPAAASSQVQVWSSLGAIAGTILAALLADVLGRRLTYALLCLGSLLVVPTLFLASSAFDVRFLVVVFLAGAITAAFYGWLPLYLPELFPTRVRATGQGFGFNFGRIIAAVGVLQLGSLKSLFAPLGWKDAEIYSVLACIYLAGMVLIWFAPETRGKPLPE